MSSIDENLIGAEATESENPERTSFGPDDGGSEIEDWDDGSEYEDPARTPHPTPGGID